ncbi:DUF1294 domain-containing protein [Alkalibacterium psychrotolerans]
MSLSFWQSALTVVFVVLNIRTLWLFYSDKKRSVRKQYRISEKKLLLSAAMMGGMGAWAGSILFRHKTRKPVFRYSLPFFFIVTTGVYLLLVW